MSNSLYESFLLSLESLWSNIMGFIPSLFGALIILIVGLIIASMLGRLAKKIAELSKIDNIFEKSGTKKEAQDIGFNLSFSDVIGWLVKWFFIIATLIAVVDVLGIRQLTIFLENLVLYLPRVIIAVIILAVGLIISGVVKKGAFSSLQALRIREKPASLLSNIAKWAIVIFSFMAALVQLGIAANLIQILFTGLIVMLAIAGGLAFGLGGKNHATKVLDWIEKEMGHK